MTHWRLEQIDRMTKFVRQAEQHHAKLQHLNLPRLANPMATLAMGALAYKAELLRMEEKKQRALDALVKSKASG